MLRLKANKTSLYKLVAEYTDLPSTRRVEFSKVPRLPDYFLDWHQENGFAQAWFATSMGRPILTITVRDIDGHQISRAVYRPTVSDLRERGMVEEFITAAERRRPERGADNGGLSPAT
jgi:hypothetical protein